MQCASVKLNLKLASVTIDQFDANMKHCIKYDYRQNTLVNVLLHLFLVNEVLCLLPTSEVENGFSDRLSFVFQVGAFLDEATEWSNTGSWSDHNNRSLGSCW